MSWQATALRRARRNSEKKGLPPPTITVAWIAAQPLWCPYLGLLLIPPNENTARRKGERHPNSPSLDRINPAVGYTPENTILTSWFWNQARNDMPVKQALRLFDQSVPNDLITHCNETHRKTKMTPTKRQIAKVLRQTAKVAAKYPSMTNALFAVCKTRGNRASIYYDNAVRAVKNYTCVSFSRFLTLPVPKLQREIRRTARALEHGLRIEG